MAEAAEIMQLDEENVHVELTYNNLDAISIMNRVKSPRAGAVVLFAGKIRLLW
jgi:molybdopterin synthase catalytic subunit